MPSTSVTLLLMVFVQAALATHSAAQAPNFAASTISTIGGIISFTRWPTPVDSVSLCVIGPMDDADAFFAAPMMAGNVPVRPHRVTLQDVTPGRCDAVYAGRLSLPERRELNQRLDGLSVLTMGEASQNCIELTMFCLRQDGPAVTFSTNIGMIARGGVRINPRVLQLGRRPATP